MMTKKERRQKQGDHFYLKMEPVRKNGDKRREGVRREERKKKQDKRRGRGVKGQAGDKEIDKRSNRKIEGREKK